MSGICEEHKGERGFHCWVCLERDVVNLEAWKDRLQKENAALAGKVQELERSKTEANRNFDEMVVIHASTESHLSEAREALKQISEREHFPLCPANWKRPEYDECVCVRGVAEKAIHGQGEKA